MKKLSSLLILLVLIVTGCKKDPFTLSPDPAINSSGLRLLQPFTNTLVNINPALASAPIVIKWSPATSETGAAIKYRWVAVGKTGGGKIDAPSISIPSDAGGTATQLSTSFGGLKTAMEKAGFPVPTENGPFPFELLWSVVAEDGKNSVRSQDVFTITVIYNRDGVTPFDLVGPGTSTVVNNISPTSTSDFITFNWKKSPSARPTVNPTKYTILFIEEKVDGSGNPVTKQSDFTAANIKFTLAAGNNGLDTFRTLSYKAFSDVLVAAGYADVSQINKLAWTVKAESGTYSVLSNNVNSYYVVREIKLFMPGGYQSAQGLGTDWTPANAPELIRDTRSGAVNKLYWTYAFFTAGQEFKITQGRAWDINWGFDGSGNLVQNGPNYVAPSTGVYRVSIDRVALKYDIRLGRMGFVGGAIPGNNWTPATTFTDPNSQMSYMSRDKFIGMNDFNTGGWKMIDNNSWNNGDVDVYNTKSYGSAGASGSIMAVNGDNFPDITSAGWRRVIWDGSDKNNIKYFVFTDLRIVGAFQGWNPSSAPSMDYQGNGVWKKTITLPAGEFKFVSAEGWDFNYGGSGGIISMNGPNLSVTGGDYTITVDERAKTYTIL